MQLTKRDIELLERINELGYVDIEFVQALWAMGIKTVYRRLRRLMLNQYLERENVLHNSPGVYRVTFKGVQINKNFLQPIKKITVTSFRHNILVARLSLKLLQQFGGRFISERRLRHEDADGKAQKHYCDGALELPDKTIAIEVELTSKSQRRLDQIIKEYQKNFAYQEVWYFYEKNEVKQKLEKTIKHLNFIRIFNLKDFIEY